jgi:hypothetical protein
MKTETYPNPTHSTNTDGADHEGLAPLLRADGDPVGHRAAQYLGHGIRVFGKIEF